MENDKPLYEIIDEDELPYAYGQDDPDRPADHDVDGSEKEKSSPSRISLLWRVMLGPATGWKDLKRASLKKEAVASVYFYPLCVGAALSQFVDLIYEANQSVLKLIVSALVIFVSYIFSYIVLPILGRPFLCAEANKTLETNFGRNALMVLFSTLALFKVAYNAIPFMEPVLVFLPLWTIYLIHRLVPVMRVPKEKWGTATVILSVLTIGLPMFWQWLFDMLLPVM